MTYPTTHHHEPKSLLNAIAGLFCAVVVADLAATGDMRKLAVGLILAVGAVTIGVAYRNILFLIAGAIAALGVASAYDSAPAGIILFTVVGIPAAVATVARDEFLDK